MGSWPGAIGAITLFVDDLDATKRFYVDVFEVTPVYEDEASAAFKFGPGIVNLLSRTAAPELVEPAAVAPGDAAARFVLSLEVGDVDATCATLAERGVELLNGPMDRPWGLRTASFRDPAGHIWEIGAPLTS